MFRELRPYQVLLDVGAAGLFTLVAFASEANGGFADSTRVLASVLTCVLMGSALALRRLSPGLALAVAWLGAIVQMSFDRPPIIADLAIFAVLYATAAYGSRLVFWSGLASAVIGAVVITAYLLVVPQFAGGRLSLATLPLVVAVLVAAGFALLLAWTIGALVRTAIRARENRRAQEVAVAVASAEQERVRIARDVHDIVAHSLTVVIAQADGARYAAGAETPGPATAALGTIAQTARAALGDVRALLGQLRHSADGGPQPTLADLEELYGQVRAAGASLAIDIDPVPRSEPPPGVQLAVYRILQEALTNALRHGGEGTVTVQLAWHDDRVDLEVRNALRGEPSAAGHGIIGMTERATLAGGRLETRAEQGAFVVRATIPIGILA